MSDKFFVVGLPRSRSYWLSVFLGCMHEGLYYYPDYRDFMTSDQVGDCTTCYLPIMDFIEHERKVIIHRDAEEVKKSLTKLFGICDFDFIDESEKLLAIEEGLHVNYDEIDEKITDIWHFCYPEELFPADRYAKLKDKKLENEPMLEEIKVMLSDLVKVQAVMSSQNQPLQ